MTVQEKIEALLAITDVDGRVVGEDTGDAFKVKVKEILADLAAAVAAPEA